MNKNSNKIIKVLINGEIILCNMQFFSLINLQNYIFPSSNSMVVEHNLKIQEGKNSRVIKITNLDKVEFISIVGGG
jgi:sulfur carrier protein ThiS